MNKVKLIVGGIALVVFAAVMVPPFLKDSQKKAARDEAFKPVAASLAPLVDSYASIDVRALAQSKTDALSGRKALFVDIEKKQLLPVQRELENEVVAQRAEDVGLVVYYREIPEAKPSVEFEGGGKGFGARLILVAVSHPEKHVVGTLRKDYPAPKATLGVQVLGEKTSVDMVAPIPEEDILGFVRKLTRT